jgi:hypothetical protein
MCLYLKQNPVTTTGFITEVNPQFIGIIVPTFDIEIVLTTH